MGRSFGGCLLLLFLAAACSSDDESGADEPVDERIAPQADSACAPSAGTFREPLEVVLTTGVSGAVIHYTTDGSAPSLTSPSFEGTPIVVTDSTVLRVQTFTDGTAAGVGGSCVYVRRELEATSDLPIVVVDGFGGGKPTDKQVYQDAAVLVIEPVGGAASLGDAPTLSTRAGYHVRGQSSASFEKTPYRIEFRDELEQDRNLPVLGMPSDADWALIGPFVDRSLIRNAFVYSLGRDMGLHAPRLAFAEVYLNYEGGALQERHYQGVYAVTEIIENNANRLDLKQLRESDTAESDLSGGYIFKFDFAAAEEPTLACEGAAALPGGGGFGMQGGTCWSDLEVVDPVPLNGAQEGWLQNYVQTLHDSLHQNPLGNWADHADSASFVDNFIIQEFSRNMDAYIRSAYFHKDRGGKLVAGPLWDYNLTFDVGGSFDNRNVEGWQYQERGGTNDWFHVLAEDAAFMDLVSVRYRELRQGLLSDADVLARIDRLSAPLAGAATRDFERWPVDEVRDSFFSFPDATTWEGQLDALRGWMLARLEWLDSAL